MQTPPTNAVRMILLLFSPFLWSGSADAVFAQTTGNWTIKLEDVNKVFIENKGQFDARLKDSGHETTIEYGVRYHGVEMYFSKSGITFRHDKAVPLSASIFAKASSNGEKEEKESTKQPSAKKENREEEEMEREKQFDLQAQFLNMTWQGANPHTQLIAEQEVSNYFTYYGNADKKTIRANAFKKITYKNIYPNIDVEYFFSENNKEGFKYNIILHPGANPSAIQMKYTDAIKMNLDSKGNLSIASAFGNFIDHAPITYDKANNIIPSAFVLKENTVSFQLKKQALSPLGTVGVGFITIDPVVTISTFGGTNEAYDVDWDYDGNVYVYGTNGGYPSSSPQLIKLNNTGTILWTAQKFADDIFYGDFAIDRISGNAYVCQAFSSGKLFKLDASGNELAFVFVNKFMQEQWRIVFNSYRRKGVIGGGGTDNNYQAATFDADLTTVVAADVLAVAEPYHDMALLAMDDTDCYMLSAKTESGSFDNTIIKCNLSNLAPATYIVPSGYNFAEVTSVKYYNWDNGGAGLTLRSNGFNGMAKSKRYLYTYDGAIFKKWNPANGTLIKSVAISADTFLYGGIVVDACDESIYLGVAKNVKKYDSTLTFITSYAAPDTVYDVALDAVGNLLACGYGFVASVATLPTTLATFTLSIDTTSSTCAGNDGSATVKVTGGNPPFYYLWEGGQTTAGITGLSPGKYPVLVWMYDNAGCMITAKANAVIVASSGFTGQSHTVTPTCFGQNHGTATETAQGGLLPYTYLWMPGGQTNQTATDLVAGTYTVVVKDAQGCKTTDKGVVGGYNPPVIRYSEVSTTNCLYQINITYNQLFPLTLTPSNLIYYPEPDGWQWWPPPPLGSHTVTITDAGGCSVDTTFTIPRLLISSVSVTTANTCKNIKGTATIKAGDATDTSVAVFYSMQGFNNANTTGIFANLNAGTYTCVASDIYACTNDPSVMFTIKDSSFITITVSPPNVSLCNGVTTSEFTVSGAKTYTWFPAQDISIKSFTDSTVTVAVNPPLTTVYSIIGKSAAGACIDTQQVEVDVCYCGDVFVPNVFSPNGDKANDVLSVYGEATCFKEYLFEIFDRWGNNVFQSTTLTDSWDGIYKGEAMDPAVFVYYISAITFSGEAIAKKGNVTLIR